MVILPQGLGFLFRSFSFVRWGAAAARPTRARNGLPKASRDLHSNFCGSAVGHKQSLITDGSSAAWDLPTKDSFSTGLLLVPTQPACSGGSEGGLRTISPQNCFRTELLLKRYCLRPPGATTLSLPAHSQVGCPLGRVDVNSQVSCRCRSIVRLAAPGSG